MNSGTLVQKLWNYCNVLRDDGMSYGDYPPLARRTGSEQVAYLLFLKMADERSRPAYNQPSLIPAEYAWPSLLARDGDELFDHYRHMLDALNKRDGLVESIFRMAAVPRSHAMPEISRFLGIVITMYFNDHNGVGRDTPGRADGKTSRRWRPRVSLGASHRLFEETDHDLGDRDTSPAGVPSLGSLLRWNRR
jgi:hypothetical protein